MSIDNFALKRRCKEVNVTVRELGDLTGLGYNIVYQFISDRRCISTASATTLHSFAKALNCSMEDIYSSYKDGELLSVGEEDGQE